MPELPEVETIVTDLKKKLIGHKIIGVDFLWDGMIKEIPSKEFNQIIKEKKILNVYRRAKNIIIVLEEDLNLLMHMKMTGHLIYTDSSWKVDQKGKWITNGHSKSPLSDPLNQSIRAIFYLDKAKILAFSDIRKFGYIKLLDTNTIEHFISQYGPEPFDKEFSTSYLKELFLKKNISVKKALMDQKNIAGIGNIYADEILFAARIRPQKIASKLSEEEIIKLHEKTREVLKNAIKMRGTSTSDFRDIAGKKGRFGEVLNVYRRTGQPCLKCNTPIKRIVIGGRGTHFCPTCQKND